MVSTKNVYRVTGKGKQYEEKNDKISGDTPLWDINFPPFPERKVHFSGTNEYIEK